MAQSCKNKISDVFEIENKIKNLEILQNLSRNRKVKS